MTDTPESNPDTAPGVRLTDIDVPFSAVMVLVWKTSIAGALIYALVWVVIYFGAAILAGMRQ